MIPERDVKDSIYVLFNGGTRDEYFGTCWTDRDLFLQKGILNPPQLGAGHSAFGNLHTSFHKFATIVESLQLQPAQVEVISG